MYVRVFENSFSSFLYLLLFFYSILPKTKTRVCIIKFEKSCLRKL